MLSGKVREVSRCITDNSFLESLISVGIRFNKVFDFVLIFLMFASWLGDNFLLDLRLEFILQFLTLAA